MCLKFILHGRSVKMSQTSFIDNYDDFDDDYEDFSREFMVNVDPKNVPVKDSRDDKGTKTASGGAISCPMKVERGLGALFVVASNNTLSPSSHETAAIRMVSIYHDVFLILY